MINALCVFMEINVKDVFQHGFCFFNKMLNDNFSLSRKYLIARVKIMNKQSRVNFILQVILKVCLLERYLKKIFLSLHIYIHA